MTRPLSRPKVVDMNQAETLAAVALSGLLMLAVLLLNELRLMRRSPNKMYPWPVTGHVALLDQDEWEYELAVQDSDQWAEQAYKMYMEDV